MDRSIIKNDFSVRFHSFRDLTSMAPLFSTHAHDCWEFLFVVQGTASCMIEGKRYPVCENSLVVIKPAQIHRLYLPGDRPLAYYSLLCDASAMFPELADKLEERTGAFKLESNSPVFDILTMLGLKNRRVVSTKSSGFRFIQIKELLSIILQATLCCSQLLPEEVTPTIQSTIRYIEENIQTHMSLDDICKAVGVTKDKLYNLFISSMLVSPTKYIQLKRVAYFQHIGEQG